jgi:hypothetical protein
MIFTTKVIEIQPDGKYHCPDSTCCVSETPTNFHRLVKHCVKHSIKLSKAKVKKESTIREENRIAKRKAKKRKIIEEMDENITIERWQQNIMLNLSEADGNLKLMLMNLIKSPIVEVIYLTAPTFEAPAIVSLTTGVSGTLPVANGGTGAAGSCHRNKIL